MSNKLKALVDPKAGGAHCWYMAGGGAAWWHIIGYMNFSHGAHDWKYFESVQKEIFPGDIEGGALKKVTTAFASKEGTIDVSLSETAKNDFDHIVKTHCCSVDGVYVFTPQSIIDRYRTAGNKAKQNKRDIRVGMLHLICRGLPITRQGVEEHKPKGGNLLAAIANKKLKHVDQ